ncbi:MAG: hypothetical protein WAW92_00675 [Minisyncoccia bacterium]
MANEKKIVTYLTYSELFETFEKSGLILLSNSLKTVGDLEAQIEHLLHDMNPIELVQFTSFLNMICQTGTTEMTMVRGISFLEETKIVPKGTGFSNKIVFHRESILNLIGQILTKKISGIQQLTGPGHEVNQKKYCEAILFNNDLINIEVNNSEASSKEVFLRDHFIREWPHYYLSDIARVVYSHRLTRYRYCYEKLLPTLEVADKSMIEKGIKAFEDKSGVSLKDYMAVVNGLFAWYFEIPFQNIKNPPSSDKPKLGFDFKNISSFYIDAKLFEKDPSFNKTIETLSKNLDTLRQLTKEEATRSRDRMVGYNKNIRVFFDNPIFKIADGYYCVIDLKFLLENVCGGLLWRVKSEDNLQDFKSSYGRLLEEYFKFLIQNIFKEAKITFGGLTGADAIVEQEDKIFVVEFTTEYYRLSSLYNPTSQDFIADAYRILFNTGRTDLRARGKNDRGKLVKLNDYVEKSQNEGKTVIPVLVTENLLGNRDFLNAFDNFYDKEIVDKKLTYLQKSLPLFLCLDDLETFWGLFDPKDAVKGFAGFAEYWIPLDKGPQFHNASSGICRYVEKERGGEAIINNYDFADFFSPKNLFKDN